MTGAELKSYLLTCLSEGNLEIVLKCLSNYTDKCGTTKLKEGILLQSARYSIVKEEYQLGKIKKEEWTTTRINIVDGLNGLIRNEIDNTSLTEDFECPEIKNENFKKHLKLVSVIALLATSFLATWFFVSRRPESEIKREAIPYLDTVHQVRDQGLQDTVTSSRKPSISPPTRPPFIPSNPLRLSMKPIPAGTYTIGTSKEEYQTLAERFSIGTGDFENDLRLREISTSGFEIAEYETTVGEYEQFLSSSPGYSAPLNWEVQKKHKNYPVTMVSVKDANRYCEWLGQQTSKQYRLPTEEEWEMAASGKIKSTFPSGEPFPKVDHVNFHGRYGGPRNGTDFPLDNSFFGVKNMTGNVAEWCASSCATGTDGFVIRGGSWDDNAYILLRSASRRCKKDPVLSYVGFRIIRLP